MPNKMMMIQPGAVGDIFICLPIAKFYADAGYDIHWPVRQQFMKHFKYIDYVTPVLLSEEVLDPDWLRSDVMKCLAEYEQGKYDFGLNLADRGPGPTQQQSDENFEQAKYRIANVPFEEKYNLEWSRTDEFEANIDFVYKKFVGDYSQRVKYAFVHDTSSDEERVDFKLVSRIVRCEDFSPDYNIFDWYHVILMADSIYVTESSVHCFCDGIVNALSPERYLLPRKNIDSMGAVATLSSNWKRDYMNG